MRTAETSEVTSSVPHWLSRYANAYHQWHSFYKNGSIFHYRPLELVESFFGTDYEGRADLNAHLILESRCSLSERRFEAKDTPGMDSLADTTCSSCSPRPRRFRLLA